jgi:hypothetical protein
VWNLSLREEERIVPQERPFRKRKSQEKIADLNQCPREPDVTSLSSATLAGAVGSTGHPALGVGCCCCTDAHLACSCETSDSILSASSACGSAEPE